MSTFVSVGNPHQHFDRLLLAVENIAHLLPQPVLVQCGNTSFESKKCQVISFLEMSRFEQLISEAELIILHAGGGGVLLAAQAGKIPVLMPRLSCYGEHVDNHQVDNAMELKLAGKAVVAENASELITAVEEALIQQRRSTSLSEIPPMVEFVGKAFSKYAMSLGK